ncbi:MAG: chemotaxis protein CheX [Legionella sp.]|uniref:chemotaxis protein CheX n=1 Tax=Legionella sp. TaxID=459 RepID=UPI00283DA83A|nr:chemotaxis protein CheX [Legionella sp.]
MSIVNTPEIWLNAATDAMNDFVGMGLGEENAAVSIMEYSKIEDPKQLFSSYLILSCEDHQVEIGLHANTENMKRITQKMLALTPEEMVDKEQTSDALNEAINIISGGIKSRLNEHIYGGIMLGLPRFSHSIEAARNREFLLQYVTIGDLSMGISVQTLA